MNYIGVGIKVPTKFVDDNPKLLEDWITHFRRNMVHYPVIGLDKEHIQTDEGFHYHIHFLSSHTKEQLLKRREKFKHKLGSKQKFYLSKKVLATKDDCYEWLAYAIKENIIDKPDGSKDKPTVELDGDLLSVDILESWRRCALKKKMNVIAQKKGEQEKKDIKKTQQDDILEYLDKSVGHVDSLFPIYTALVTWQRQNDKYLENFYMTKIAHIFIQKNTKMSPEEIVGLRFRHL